MNNSQRVRLDRESGASHDLNRLLDEPYFGMMLAIEDIFFEVGYFENNSINEAIREVL